MIRLFLGMLSVFGPQTLTDYLTDQFTPVFTEYNKVICMKHR